MVRSGLQRPHVARRVSELDQLSAAEQQVIDELDSGEIVVIGDGALPAPGDEARRVRAGSRTDVGGGWPERRGGLSRGRVRC